MSDKIMNFCPSTGTEKPYPSHAKQWREYTVKARSSIILGLESRGTLEILEATPLDI